MTTYLLFASIVVVVALVFDRYILRTKIVGTRRWVVTTISMIVLTLVFNNLIVGFGVVTYDQSRISGLKVPFMPIEDLSYTIAVSTIVPAMITYYAKKP